MLPGESAYEIYIATDEAGNFVDPETGKYTIDAYANLKDEYGRDIKADDKANFDIRKHSKMWVYLRWIILLAIIIAIIAFILTRKAWPKRMFFVTDRKNGRITTNDNSNIVSNAFPAILPCKMEKASNVYQRGKKTACVTVTKVTPSYQVISFKIGSSPEYTRSGSDFLDSNNKEFTPVTVRNNTRIKVERRNASTIEGTVYINGKK